MNELEKRKRVVLCYYGWGVVGLIFGVMHLVGAVVYYLGAVEG